MLVVFTNKSGSTVDMFEAVAMDLIKLMGKRAVVPSAINAEDLPATLITLQSGLAALETIKDDEQEKRDEEDDTAVSPIGLSSRAYPLVTLIQQSIKDESFLMWDFK